MNIIRKLIYVLQKESYDAGRFLSFVYHNWRWWSWEKRQAIDWTAKAKALYFSLWLLVIGLIILFFYFWHWWGFLLLLLLIPILPVLTLFVLLLFSPVDYFLKKLIIRRAERALLKTEVKVIGITGSYGKTSLKEILAIILGSGFKIVKTPNNVNTDLGIAYFILAHRAEIATSDFFIVEMGAYQIGDIAQVCDLVHPQYSFLTGINESHLERFGNLQNTIRAKFELGERTAQKVVLNLTDENVKDNYSKFKLPDYLGVDERAVSDIKILSEFAGLSFQYQKYNFSTPWLAKHNIILIAMALALAEDLGLDLAKAAEPLASAPFIKNRLEPIWNAASQLLVIDDSYNGNFSGFISGLEVLNRARGRRLVITPGLVELGDKKEERHREIARLYASRNLDLVLLIKNSATDYIIDEFKKIGFSKYRVYPDALSAHQDLGAVLRAGDTIIFQNDWPDNYK
ncbi:MAG: UDP-N-acetylmuramoyl-tripeptide--D-alanyl-D-alanine ligase [Candidatus Falkowbacteria bacterium]|nr:UDP-N-acetylmuramoyl-tripeptide--D-alanyl-D-alanine ligase [Candidatus Falkowbacteria bacterium]